MLKCDFMGIETGHMANSEPDFFKCSAIIYRTDIWAISILYSHLALNKNKNKHNSQNVKQSLI